MKFRKKPVVIEAIQYNGDNAFEVIRFSENYAAQTMGTSLTIKTLEGQMQCSVNDWVIKGVNGEFYPCKPDIFKKTYQPVIEVLGRVKKRVENLIDDLTWQQDKNDQLISNLYKLLVKK